MGKAAKIAVMTGRVRGEGGTLGSESRGSGAPTQVTAGARSSTEQAGLSFARGLHIQPGDRVAGRYDVVRLLGEGGMGIVFGCRDRFSGDEVALKQVLVPEGANTSDYVTWFYKEARALAALDHPGIVGARDFGQLVDGSPYLVMDLARGTCLHELSQQPLRFHALWSIFSDILEALAHAHARQVVHGDLKPSNVLVEGRPEGPPRVRILDFGLAWLKEDPHDERLDGEKAMVFAPQAGAGTPGFMAPEQIQHELHHVCGATDLYALGCLAFQLLLGKAVFAGAPEELLRLHAYSRAPRADPTCFPPGTPEGVSDFIAQLLEPRPWRRYEFAAEAQRAWAKLKPIGPRRPADWSLEPQEPRSVRESTPPVARAPHHFQAGTSIRGGLLSIRRPPLVGRQKSLARLLRLAREMAGGRGPTHRLILLLGPAGIGKTRLGEWLATRVHEQALLVPLTARYRREQGPFGGMTGAVTRYYNFEHCDRDAIERSLLARWGGESNDRQLRAWVAGAAEWLRPRPPGDSESVGPSGVRFTIDSLQVRRRVARFCIRRVANGRPLLLFLDDLHNASEAVIEGLMRIPESDPDQRILLLATVRTEEVQLSSQTARNLRELRTRLAGEVMQVGPMQPQDTQALLDASLPLNREGVVEAARRSRGFPLFALQQLHAWSQAGDLQLSAGRYIVNEEALTTRPKTTSDLWEARLAGLNNTQRRAAAALSALGLDMRSVVMLALLRDLAFDGTAQLRALREAEVIVPRGPERYTWPHALLQEHLLLGLRRERDAREVFARVAKALCRHPEALTRRIVRQRSVSWLQAGDGDRAARVFLDFLCQSPRGSLQPRATLNDLRLFEGRVGAACRAPLSRWKAEALRLIGKTLEAKAEAQQAARELASLCQQAGSGAQGRSLELEWAHAQRILGELEGVQGDPDQGAALLDRAATIFERWEDVGGRAACLVGRATLTFHQGHFDRARAAASLGANLFERERDSFGQGQCRLLLAWVAQSEGDAPAASKLAAAAGAHFEAAGYRPGLAETTLLVAHIEHRLCNFANASEGARTALSQFEALGVPTGIASACRLLSMIAIDTDDLERARACAERASSLCADLSDATGGAESELLMAQVELARFSPNLAALHLEQVAAHMDRDASLKQHYLLTLCWLEAELGTRPEPPTERLAEARDTFAEPSQAAQHTSQLLARLSRYPSTPRASRGIIAAWRQAIDRGKGPRRKPQPSPAGGDEPTGGSRG